MKKEEAEAGEVVHPERGDARVHTQLVLTEVGMKWIGKQCSVAEGYSCLIGKVQGSGLGVSELRGPVMKQY